MYSLDKKYLKIILPTVGIFEISYEASKTL